MQRRWKLSAGPAGRHVEPLESWTVVKCDWSSTRQGPEVIHFLLARHGGIAPPVRRRSPRVLTLAEREDISRGIASGLLDAGHRPRVCSRAVLDGKPGGSPPWRARAVSRQRSRSAGLGVGLAAQSRACLAIHSKLRKIVASKLMLDWSPEQISGWLKQPVSRRREPARVSRNDLSQPVHSSARSAETGADSAPAIASGGSAARGTPAFTDTPKARSSMPFPSANDLRKSKIVLFPVIGKAICCAGHATATWPRW